ncbi:HelD family protein [Blastococcus tunisiensis]|uniref:DNA helicase IV n=1 Tax=Blastococcus tunisiensis TaxID=1798228 RepID=A0A1I2B7I5_9ACTN|nr:AAA family ATPase [Blastococcus sp. DSM 46838]SFE52101.1 DNA helicase IV [Blastococcus sp. DSM 46838]
MTASPATPETDRHPDLDLEQQYVTRSYQLLDKGLADVEHTYASYQEGNRATAAALRRALDILRNSRGSGQLVFGRVDRDGEPLYIGRRRVHDESKNLVVASWHAPAAQVFYQATPEDPQDLDLKRVFVEQDRILSRLVDEITAASVGVAQDADAAGPTPVSDALLIELDRSRDGAMREVVATIQAEQFRIIRAPRDRVLVVQGGPGTGKTVVGLHRAAWHAFNDEGLRRAGILVVAPNTAFLSYMSGVLPSLDASDVLQVDLASLYPGEAMATGTDPVGVARVKGSAAMAQVLRRALDARRGWGDEDLEFSLGGARTTLAADRIRALVDDAAARDLPHNQARDVLRQSLSAAAYAAYAGAQAAGGRAVIATEPAIRRLSTFNNALDRMWPTFTAEELLRGLYGTQSWLVEASDGLLSADERAGLYREPRTSIGDEPWTDGDLFCLDELSYLLNGEVRTYRHVVVDEAQDLSPMQARALARRCPSGSFTVLGDLAQATGAWIRDSWSELTTHLSTSETVVETLTIGYRVPSAALELAARLLPLISPNLEAPTSVRLGAGDPTVHIAGEDSVEDRALDLAAADVEDGRTTAIVLPDSSFDSLLERCTAAGTTIGNGRDGDFSHPLTLVPASSVKGLEFDSVVLLGPTELARSAVDGRRLLYIAMTRCTQVLRLVDDGVLPEGLDHLLPSGPDPDEPEVEVIGDDGARAEKRADSADLDALVELVTRLGDDDRALVMALARRLLQEGTRDSEV